MDAILLCMKKRGIRFFSKIKLSNTEIIRFHRKENFLGLLRNRLGEYDNILIMAHGSKDGILTPTCSRGQLKYDLYITEKESHHFINNFVFAVSCSTANEFGRSCVTQGALAYLGYEIEIGKLFNSYLDSQDYTGLPKNVSNSIDIIVKKIFIEQLSKAYERFIKEPISVKVLMELLSLSIEKEISLVYNMTVEELHNKYKVKIAKKHLKIFFPTMITKTLSFLNEMHDRFVCIGEINYISSTFIEYEKANGKASQEIKGELENNEFFKAIESKEYKDYLRSVV